MGRRHTNYADKGAHTDVEDVYASRKIVDGLDFDYLLGADLEQVQQEEELDS